jgi:Arc/MetJ-type ribon-helix-helix transcriptional regulator
MDDRLGSMDGRFGSMQDMLRDALVTMNNTMAGIQRFLDRQDRQPGPAE